MTDEMNNETITEPGDATCLNAAGEGKKSGELIRISLLGAEGAGKTSFLAGLACLGYDVLNGPFALYPVDHETATYCNELVRAFRHGEWIPSTNVTTTLHFRVQERNVDSCLDIATIDYPGEDFRMAFNRMSKEKIDDFVEHLYSSQILILLIDEADLAAANDPDRVEQIQERLRAKLVAIHDVLRNRANHVDPSVSDPVSLCVCVTKADRNRGLWSAMTRCGGGRAFTRRLVQKCLGKFETKLRRETGIDRVVYFPISSVGNTSQDSSGHEFPDGANLRPLGYEPLLDWLSSHKRRVRRGGLFHTIGKLALMILVLGGAISVWSAFKSEQGIQIFRNELMTPIEKIRESNPYRLSEKVRQERNRLVREQLDRIESGVGGTLKKDRLMEYRRELQELTTCGLGDCVSDAERILKTIQEKSVLSDYEDLLKLHKSGSRDFRDRAERFLLEWHDSTYARDIEVMLANEARNEAFKRVREVARLHVRDRSMLEKKGNDILNLVGDSNVPISETERLKMKSAALLAKSLSNRQEYRVILQRYGGFAYNEVQRLRVKVNGRNVCDASRSSTKSKECNVAMPFTFEWRFGDTIYIQLEAETGTFRSSYETVADKTLRLPDSLDTLNGTIVLSPLFGTWDWSLPKYKGSSGYFVECRVEGIDTEQWLAFRHYIYPGNAWRDETESAK